MLRYVHYLKNVYKKYFKKYRQLKMFFDGIILPIKSFFCLDTFIWMHKYRVEEPVHAKYIDFFLFTTSLFLFIHNRSKKERKVRGVPHNKFFINVMNNIMR